MERVLRDLRIFRIFGGTNDILRLFLALSGIEVAAWVSGGWGREGSSLTHTSPTALPPWWGGKWAPGTEGHCWSPALPPLQTPCLRRA